VRYCLRHCAKPGLTAIMIFAFAFAMTLSAAPPAGMAHIQRMAFSQPQPAPVPNVIDGQPCPDVMVIAARGSGEAPSDWRHLPAYTSDQYHGAGETLYSLYGALQRGDQGLTFSLAPVVYRADNVSDLLNLSHPGRYLTDAGMGAQGIALDIQNTDAACGRTVRYILAGYSLGAWTVHDALNELSRRQLGEIAGVALFGDPKFQPHQSIVRDFENQDTYHGIAYYAIDQSDNGIPRALVVHTGSWCLPQDPVCQFQYNHPKRWAHEAQLCANGSGACAHFQYPTDGETVNAAAFLNLFLPTATLLPHLTGTTPPDGTVGTPYTWTATAAPAGTYTWTSAGTLPPGLSFTTAGVLSGTPTQGGNFTFSITATGAFERSVTGPVTLTINSGTTTTWTPAKAPLPAGVDTDPGVSLDSVACASASSCVAVGHYSDSSGNQQGLLETLSGTTWTPAEAPLPAGAESDPNVSLDSVACGSASSCVAVGYDENSPSGQRGLLEALSGTTWTSAWAPAPANADDPPDDILYSVACPSAASCVAVGSYFVDVNPTSPAGYNAGLVETLSGGTWTPAQTPVESFSQTSLAFVTCTSASSCVAAGDDNGTPLLEALSGTTWTPTDAPLPSDASGGVSAVNSVACLPASSCVAVGIYNWFDIGLSQGLLLSGSGTSWTAAEAPVPSGVAATADVILSSVACVSVSSCVAVGSHNTSIFQSQLGLLETLSGTTWTAAEVPLPDSTTGENSYLSAVACPSALCIAVGGYNDSSDNSQGLLLTGPS
jgi:Cutinase